MKKIYFIILTLLLFISFDVLAEEDCSIANGQQSYVISFENNVEGIENITFCSTCANERPELPEPTRENYTFLGWYADEELTIPILNLSEDSDKFVVTNEGECSNEIRVNLYAKWQKNCITKTGFYKYNLIFETNGGENIETIQLCPGCSTIGEKTNLDYELPILKKESYEFDGWYADSNYEKKIDSLEEDYEIIDFIEDFDSDNCSLNTYTGKIYAKWKEVTKVNVPDTMKRMQDTYMLLSSLIIVLGLSIIYILKFKKQKN